MPRVTFLDADGAPISGRSVANWDAVRDIGRWPNRTASVRVDDGNDSGRTFYKAPPLPDPVNPDAEERLEARQAGPRRTPGAVPNGER